MIGKTISHYKIFEKLGEGGMGVVYKAEDTRLKRTVALKFLPPELVQSAEWKERFIREAQAAAALAHPSICHTYEINDAKDQAFIAMEYVDGKSLADRIAAGALPVEEAVNIALRVAEGLKHAYKRGVVHRDIKPANIMVTEDGQAKIMDFGLAKLAGKTRLTKTATVMGTIAYMSPEQARGDSTIDHRTDVWSLGVLLYEMLTGVLPFDAETDTGLIYKILYEDPEPIRNHRSDIPDSLASIFEKAMQKGPQDRYERAEELISDLEAVKSGVSVSAGISSPSIAVLPFANMSADPEQEYFCDGLSEELITALTQLKDLHVVARTSAFSFKNKDVDIHEIGRRLKVQTVLEGSVRKAGNRLRITAQLVKVDDGYHLWSEKYDRQMDDIFAIQDEITLAIVEKLKPRLLGEQESRIARRQTVDLEAYNLYLKGRWFFNKQTGHELKKAIECFEQAIERAPDYAQAYAGIADSYVELPFIHSFAPREAYPRAKEAAFKAMGIDDTSAEAHSSLAVFLQVYEYDWGRSEKEFKRAIELNPGYAMAHERYALLLYRVGRFDEAIAEMKRALELDPLSLHTHRDAGFLFCLARKPDQAIDILRRLLELDPSYNAAHAILGYTYLHNSMYEEAIEEFRKEKEGPGGVDPAVDAALGVIDASTGKIDEARQVLEKLIERSKREYIPRCWIAWLSFAVEGKDQGFNWLEKAYEEHDNWLCNLKVDLFFDLLNLRSDPRYIALLKKIGLDK